MLVPLVTFSSECIATMKGGENMRDLQETNRQGVTVAYAEYDSIDDAVEGLGAPDSLGLINAGVKRRAMVNAGRKGQNRLMPLLKKRPDLLEELEAMEVDE